MDQIRPTYDYPIQTGYFGQPIPAISSSLNYFPAKQAPQPSAPTFGVPAPSSSSFLKSKLCKGLLIAGGIVLGIGLLLTVILIALYASSTSIFSFFNPL